ncbi:MAG TPA: ROK family protein [Terracidiphilus sp.]|nr:ROK family protein [Terracidiphilus sp.]
MTITETSVLVFDVGGSHVSAAVCRRGDLRLGQVARAHYGECKSSADFVDLLHALGVQSTAGYARIAGAGLAMPGPFDYELGISRMKHKLPYLFGVDLRAALATSFNWLPAQVRFINDAAAFLLGEAGAGAARGVRRSVGITLGTGIGSAFAINGRIVTSGDGVPPGGEIWDMPFERGIVEDTLSTYALQHSYLARAGRQAEVADIAAAAPHDPAAADVFKEFGRSLGIVLRQLTAEFSPDVVVIGGGISQSAQLFLPAAEAELRGMKTELRVSTLRESAALVGAGVTWFAQGD